MPFEPLYDRISVSRLAPETHTPAGLILPGTKDKPARGTVIAVGSGRITKHGEVVPLRVRPGDVVLFSKYAGDEVEIDGEERVILREDEVLGVLRPPV